MDGHHPRQRVDRIPPTGRLTVNQGFCPWERPHVAQSAPVSGTILGWPPRREYGTGGISWLSRDRGFGCAFGCPPRTVGAPRSSSGPRGARRYGGWPRRSWRSSSPKWPSDRPNRRDRPSPWPRCSRHTWPTARESAVPSPPSRATDTPRHRSRRRSGRSARRAHRPGSGRVLRPAGRTPGGNTIRQTHAILTAALEQALKWGWITDNPAKGATAPGRHRPKRKALALTDIAKMVAAASTPRKNENGRRRGAGDGDRHGSVDRGETWRTVRNEVERHRPRHLLHHD